ncbi:MAG TPA: hypothetical protein VKG38_05865 [Solirubrobacteraceae bacterium]|nr:hypothetical protein [Solirubrobacteraceae bacterium]
MSGSYLTLGGPAGGAHPAVVRRRVHELALLGLTALIALLLALGVAAAVPHPNVLLTIVAIVGVLAITYLMVSPRLDVSVLVLGLYLGCLDGPVKLISGGGTSVSAMRDVLIFAVCLGAIMRWLTKKEPLQLPPLSVWVLGFVLCVAVEALNPNTVGVTKILGGFRQQLEWVPFFFFGYLLIRSKQRLRKLFLLFGVIAAANSLVAAYQVRLNPHTLAAWGPGYAEKVLGTNGVTGTTFAGGVRPLALGSDIGYSGTVGVIALPCMLALLATARPRRRWIYALLALLAALGIGVSLSRTSVIGAVVTLVAFAALSFSLGSRVARPLVAMLVLLALAIPLASVVTSTEGTAIFSRYSSIAGSQAASSATGDKSATLSQLGVDVANDPFGFGLGVSGAASSFGGHTSVRLEGHGFSSETEFNFLMNEIGLPGLLLWLAFLIYLGTLVLRRLSLIKDLEVRLELAALFSVLAGLFIEGFAGAFTAGTAGGPYFWLTAGIAAYWLAGPGLKYPANAAPAIPASTAAAPGGAV